MRRHLLRHVYSSNKSAAQQQQLTNITCKMSKLVFMSKFFQIIYKSVANYKENFRGRTSKNLEQHNLFKHSQEMFNKLIQCSVCNFKCSTEDGLVQHNEQMHKCLNPVRLVTFCSITTIFLDFQASPQF